MHRETRNCAWQLSIAINWLRWFLPIPLSWSSWWPSFVLPWCSSPTKRYASIQTCPWISVTFSWHKECSTLSGQCLEAWISPYRLFSSSCAKDWSMSLSRTMETIFGWSPYGHLQLPTLQQEKNTNTCATSVAEVWIELNSSLTLLHMFKIGQVTLRNTNIHNK